MNTVTNKVARLIGKDESLRFLNLAVYQGAPAKKGVTTLVSRDRPRLQDRSTRSHVPGNGGVGKPFATGKGQSGSAPFRNSVQQISILPLRSGRCVSGPLRTLSRDRAVIGREY